MAENAQAPVLSKWVHPHELIRVAVHERRCCFSSRRRICDGCGLGILEQAYICGLQPKPCSKYNICEACFNLGPGEGGLTQTATRANWSEEGAQLATPAEPCRENSVFSKITKASSAVTRSFPVTSQVEPLANAVVSKTATSQNNATSPRVAAANFDFKLQLDEDAHSRWKRFAGSSNPRCATEAECLLLDQAREASAHLRFLQLTVNSLVELHWEQSSCDKNRCLELYSPLAGIPAETKAKLIERACQVLEAERSLGSLVGMAVGDSLGAPFEFLDACDDVGVWGSYVDFNSFKAYGTKNKFRVAPGQWTDDSSMGLCLADTLLARGHYDGADSRIRYHNWWFRGYNNAFGNAQRIGSVGLGGNVAESLRAMEPGVKPSPAYEARTQDAGNGTIMRLAPVPIFHARDPLKAAHESASSSGATHPGPIAAAACAFQGFLIARSIQRGTEAATAKAFLDQVVNDFIACGLPGAEKCPEVRRLLESNEPERGKEECWNWRAEKLQIERTLQARGRCYNGYPCVPEYFGSYCIDGLAVALWSFYHTSSFAEAIVRCTNFLGDADTTTAICGQIAGAFYGYKAIDECLINLLTEWDDHDIACRAALLWAVQLVPQ